MISMPTPTGLLFVWLHFAFHLYFVTVFSLYIGDHELYDVYIFLRTLKWIELNWMPIFSSLYIKPYKMGEHQSIGFAVRLVKSVNDGSLSFLTYSKWRLNVLARWLRRVFFQYYDGKCVIFVFNVHLLLNTK